MSLFTFSLQLKARILGQGTDKQKVSGLFILLQQVSCPTPLSSIIT
jgi:hypothetical protein